jgi:hypothetical protein
MLGMSEPQLKVIKIVYAVHVTPVPGGAWSWSNGSKYNTRVMRAYSTEAEAKAYKEGFEYQTSHLDESKRATCEIKEEIRLDSTKKVEDFI